ncbi:SusC/RagA family TonB-linked outer membrane protein [Mucilaginibacter pedocola]|uniref:TonB-dependent receptor plug domain-containing protein n=1 Tax=Mucilaginibacter pedocola TaxID=1792845 RepID=A0A1S9PG85_9SPHI|nr:SusC/RagA family TonB-linked outer membrane protein [Mucilaginibacter pedocola]OOQ59995.1 hypothetical protein BC343_27070 [Mucilaginibacter pedocola]
MKKLYLLLFAIYFLAGGTLAAAQAPALRGTVLDAEKHPVMGANVALLGTRYGAVSDAAGHFTLDAPVGEYRLRVSFIGFKPYELGVRLPMADTVTAVLQSNSNSLSEVTISTGYQQIPKERATGSFVAVPRTLLERSVSTDIVDRLRDVVPGLSFNQNGSRLSIRGQSTLFSNADPLIVVDGFPYNEPIENLNPNDVESISVLKDAAAASIWGTRAGNGVIVITTKKGGFNRPIAITFNSNVQVGERPALFSLNRMSSADYIGIEKRLFSEGYFDGTEAADNHLPLSPVVELLIQQRDGGLSAVEADKRIQALSAIDTRDDLLKYFYRLSVKQQYALSVDGGAALNRYFFSAGYDRNLDNEAGNGFNRVTLNGSQTTRIGGRLELSTALNFTRTAADKNNPFGLTWNRGQLLFPYARLAGPNGEPLAVTKDLRQNFVDAAPGAGLLDWNYRPLQDLRLSDNQNTQTAFRLNTGLKYRVLPGLNAQVLYQYEQTQTSGRDHQPAESFFARNLVNRYTQDDGSGTLTRTIPAGGILDLANSAAASHDGRAQLDYEHLFGTKHELTALAGYEVQSLNVAGDTYRLYGYDNVHASSGPVDGVTPFTYYDDLNNSAPIPLNQSNSSATDHYRSYYANAAYTYDGRITFSASGRLDQSNLFGVRTNQKGVPLYSAGLAWNIAKEAFYHMAWLPELKLRASFGYNGNSNKSLSAYTTASYFDGSDALTGLPYAGVINPPNPQLRWERVRHINFGLDFGALDGRLSGSFEYYFKRGIDLIGQAGFAPSTGITIFTGNTATASGHGLDLNLESKNITGKFNWVSNFYLSYVTDKVVAYNRQSTALSYLSDGSIGGYALSGRPLYAIYSYRSAGLDPQTGDPQGYLDGNISKDYGAILAAATPDNLVYHGPSRPPVFGAFRNTFTYGNWSLSANISYKLGYYFRRSSIRYGSDYGLAGQNGDYAIHWQQPGDEARTVVPSLPAVPDTQRDQFYAYSSALVESGSHIRLQDIRLAWSLPKYKLQVYAYAANLGILWRANKAGLDPDYANTYTVPRTIAGGIRFTY